jgi:hypothetical protein
MALPESAKELIRAGTIGHLVTIGRDRGPHVTCVWVYHRRPGGRHRPVGAD